MDEGETHPRFNTPLIQEGSYFLPVMVFKEESVEEVGVSRGVRGYKRWLHSWQIF